MIVFPLRQTPGLLLLHAGGSIFVRTLAPHQTILVKPTALVFKDPAVQMHLHFEHPSAFFSSWVTGATGTFGCACRDRASRHPVRVRAGRGRSAQYFRFSPTQPSSAGKWRRRSHFSASFRCSLSVHLSITTSSPAWRARSPQSRALPLLHPDDLCADTDRRFDDLRYVLGAAENVDHIDFSGISSSARSSFRPAPPPRSDSPE